MVLLALGSLSNVVGYQTVQSSNQQTIKAAVNQRELLFQTICDLANNKEIQRIIIKSQMSRGIPLVSDIPVLTKNQLKQMYFYGLILSKVISRTRMQSIVGNYQFNNQEMQKKISAVIEKDATFKGEITWLSHPECDCQTKNLKIWRFPVICLVLLPLEIIASFASLFIEKLTGNFFPLFDYIISDIAYFLGCFWTVHPPYDSLSLHLIQ
jgi:hypothetical protein